MIFNDFAERIAPGYCGVHSSWGVVVKGIIHAEENGEPAFSHHAFTDTRERAKLLMPYAHEACENDPNAYRQVLDVYEFAMLRNDQNKGRGDYSERIGQLSKSIAIENPTFLEGETVEAFTRDWWNN
jgi:hypothetical protein